MIFDSKAKLIWSSMDNVSIWIFSKDQYLNKDFDNILQCGQLNDTVLENRGYFNPSYYILLNYKNGNHYELITYKNKGALKFIEIPYDVKILIVNKCLEGITGPFKLIPDFNSLKEKLNLSNIQMTGGEEINPNYYNPEIVFMIHDDSSNIHLPGKYNGEKLDKTNNLKFLNLDNDWRKKLSNGYNSKFKLDEKNWNSVDHYLYGSRYKYNNPDFYNLFSLDSDSSISKNINLAKNISKEKEKNNSVVVDNDYFNGRNKKELEKALKCKFTQNKDLLDILLKTKPAKLQKYVKRSPPIPLNELMKLRYDLSVN